MIRLKTIQNRNVSVAETEFLQALVEYMDNTSPDRIRIIAKENIETGKPKMVPVVAIVPIMNPHEVVYFTDSILTENDIQDGLVDN